VLNIPLVTNFGAGVGAFVGAIDGVSDGVSDGASDGSVDGTKDGTVDGTVDGTADGTTDGASDIAGVCAFTVVIVKHHTPTTDNKVKQLLVNIFIILLGLLLRMPSIKRFTVVVLFVIDNLSYFRLVAFLFSIRSFFSPW
jgi:hypothetical protein